MFTNILDVVWSFEIIVCLWFVSSIIMLVSLIILMIILFLSFFSFKFILHFSILLFYWNMLTFLGCCKLLYIVRSIDLRFTMILITLMNSPWGKHVLHLRLLWIKVMFGSICISMWVKLSLISFWIYLVYFLWAYWFINFELLMVGTIWSPILEMRKPRVWVHISVKGHTCWIFISTLYVWILDNACFGSN